MAPRRELLQLFYLSSPLSSRSADAPRTNFAPPFFFLSSLSFLSHCGETFSTCLKATICGFHPMLETRLVTFHLCIFCSSFLQFGTHGQRVRRHFKRLQVIGERIEFGRRQGGLFLLLLFLLRHCWEARTDSN